MNAVVGKGIKTCDKIILITAIIPAIKGIYLQRNPSVPTPIFTTKLFIPQSRGGAVSRPRLLERLKAGLAGRLTLVSAPAGYGKSTLLSEWVRQAGIPAAWLSLDPADNDPTRFWAHFVATLRMIPPLRESQVGENLLGLLQASPMPERESLLGILVTEIAVFPGRFILILDDFHTVTESQIQDGLFYLLESLPSGLSGMHLVISSRSDPPWPLARLRVNREITEVRARDLRFTPGEAALFLNDVMQLALLSDDIAELNKRTEGWVAGLQMAALSMQGREDVSEFLQGFSGSHRFVLDYLMEEVLSQQKPEILDFLLKTSILERLTGDLCDAVTGDEGSSEILQQLEKANMFLVALDDQRNWYRYHQLFADLLQKQLRTRYPALLPELHRRASQWHAQAGSSREAVAHALNTEDWDFAAPQVEKHVLGLIQHGEITLARQWMSSLPDEAIRPRPILCIAQAWTSAKYGTVKLAEDLLMQAEAALSSDPPEDGSFDPQVYDFVSRQIAVLQVVIARARGDSTQRQQELALEALDRVVPAGDSAARATLLLRLGFCYLDLGKDEQADRTFSQAFELGQSSGNHYTAHAASYGRMVIARRHGQLHKLSAICRQTLDANRERDDPPQSLTGIALSMSGSLLYERNDLDQAERDLTQGLRLVQQVGMTELLIKGHFALACTKTAQGNVESPPDLVRIAEKGNPGLASYAAALQTRFNLLLAQQNVGPQHEEEAVHWAGTQQLVLRGQPTYDWEIYEKLVYARVLRWQYQAQPGKRRKARLLEVLDFIQEQIQPLEKLDWLGVLVELYAVMAVILQTLERKAEALTALERALLLAEPQGFVRTFVDEGEPMHQLVQLALAEGICKVYTRGIMSAFDAPTNLSQSKEMVQTVGLIEPLSEREQQVLRLLNSRLSVPEIAEEIHLAPTTVRTHVQNIYRKLDVHGRIEALQRAEELGLL